MNTEAIANRNIDALSPKQLEAYLFATGWDCDGDLNQIATIWHRPEQSLADLEVVVPKVLDLRDFRDRMLDAINNIASFEGVSTEEVVAAALGQYADVVRIRVIHYDVEGGTIPLKDGVQLNLHARDLMAAAAMSAPVKKRHFSGKRTPEANEFLDSLRLGQTEEGSYIINIIAPTLPTDDSGLDGSISQGAVVTETLASGLAALDEALEEFASTKQLSTFDSSVNSGASANLCDALIGMSGAQRQRSFEITVLPSRAPVSARRRGPQSFSFDVEKVEYMTAASEYFKGNYVLENHTIQGLIKRLDRPTDMDAGTITVATKLMGGEKFVSIELQPAEYLEAINAHRLKEEVRCVGDLHVSPRKARLLNPHEFVVMTSRNLFDDTH